VFQVNEDVSIAEVDGHLIVVNLKTGLYYSLNDTASLILNMIRQERLASEIVQELCSRYDVPEETARRDFERCVESLVEELVLIQPRK
jgi:hypothetical protein